MQENEMQRFGEITLMEIDTTAEGGYIRICDENNYNNNIVITIEEIRSITLLYELLGYVWIETVATTFIYQDGYLQIAHIFYNMIFKKKDVDDFVNYIEKVYTHEK